jgi:hypothetical protein
MRSSTYGFFAWPPRALQPLDECVERKFAHSLRFAFPSSTAPAARSLAATAESREGIEPARASDPAVVVIRSAVSMLSLTRIGTPCNGPRTRPARRSASSASAIASASGFVSMTCRSVGPFRSSSSMRARYCPVIAYDVQRPDAKPACRSAMVASSSSKAAGVNPCTAGNSAASIDSRVSASAPLASPK